MREEGESFVKRNDLKIAVFGAGGAVGSILASFLQQIEDVSQIICLDCNLERMFSFLKNRKKIIHVLTAEGTNEKLIRRLKDCFLIINAASSLLNKRIMKIALELGSNYLDFASFDNDNQAEQKSFHKRFKEKKIAGWINWGTGPGLTNLLVAKLIDGLTDCVVRIRVAEDTKLAKQANGQEPLIFLWNPQLLIDEITSPVYPFSKDPRRARIIREPFSGPEFCVFPYPIGKITCRHMNEKETITLKNMPDIPEADVKTGGDDLERLFKILPKIKKRIKKGQIKEYLKNIKTPSPNEIKKMIQKGIILDGRVAILVEVDGQNPETEERIFKKATWMGLGLREVSHGTTHMNFNTALVALCAIRQIINSSGPAPGVWAPEEISKTDREAILDCIQKKSNPVHFQT